MSQSTHQIKIRAKDETSGAFRSIESGAKMTSARINKMVAAGAVAAIVVASAKMASAAIRYGAKTVNEMARIGEAASLASTSVDDLTRVVAALSTVGLGGINIESFSKALATMQKTTGRDGLNGFYQTIDALSQIDDLSQRATESTRVFGDMGYRLLPLVSGSEQARKSLRSVVDFMPSIGQGAIDSTSSAKRALDIFNLEIKYGFMKMVGFLMSWLEDTFNGPGGLVATALRAANALVWAFKTAMNDVADLWDRFKAGWELIGGTIGTAVGALAGGAAIRTAINLAKDDFFTTRSAMMEVLNGSYQLRKIQIDEAYNSRNIDLGKLAADLNKLKRGLGTYRQAPEAPEAPEAPQTPQAPQPAANPEVNAIDRARERERQSNSLILGATAEALRLSVLGPQTQNEMKKQTKLLEDIKSNVKKTADNSSNTSQSGYKELN